MFILLFLSLFPANSLSQSNPKVCLDSICFTGSLITTNKGLKFASFQGIKYGQAPIGKLRFKPPQASKTLLKKPHIFFSLDHTVTENQMPGEVFVFEKRIGNAVCFFFKLRCQQKTTTLTYIRCLVFGFYSTADPMKRRIDQL